MGNSNLNTKKITLKDILFIAIVLFFFVKAVSSWMKLTDRLKIIRESKIRVAEEQKKQEDLKRELAQAESQKYIEKQAREKLNMGKEGEIIILLPTPDLSPSPTPIPLDTSSNWQKWVRLFW